MPLQEMVGTFDKERNRFESNYMVGLLTNKTVIVGSAEPGDLVQGCEYVFMGDWVKHQKYGPQFKFAGFTRRAPSSRRGVLEYLKRFEMFTPLRINRMMDIEGYDKLIGRLKNDSANVAYSCFKGDPAYRDLVGKCMSLGAALIQDQQFQETKLQLLEILAERGFPHSLPDECIKKFGVLAAVRIRKDPFAMMVAKLPGCGFLRCDRLYCELGLPRDRMRRQIMCAWNAIRTDGSGTTWHEWETIARTVAQQLTGNVRVERALRAAVRMKWLVTRAIGGKLWIADRKRAENEDTILKHLKVIA